MDWLRRGCSRADIIVWDRSLGGIKEAGYTGSDGYRIKAIPPSDGYDPKAALSAPVLGNLVWGDFEYQPNKGKMPLLSDNENTSSLSHIARILSTEVTKVINVPVLSSSETNGIAGCLYNMTIPNIDNWRRFTQSSGFGRESLAEIYSNPMIGKKVVLNLMDGLIAQYAGARSRSLIGRCIWDSVCQQRSGGGGRDCLEAITAMAVAGEFAFHWSHRRLCASCFGYRPWEFGTKSH